MTGGGGEAQMLDCRGPGEHLLFLQGLLGGREMLGGGAVAHSGSRS